MSKRKRYEEEVKERDKYVEEHDDSYGEDDDIKEFEQAIFQDEKEEVIDIIEIDENDIDYAIVIKNLRHILSDLNYYTKECKICKIVVHEDKCKYWKNCKECYCYVCDICIEENIADNDKLSKKDEFKILCSDCK